MTVDSTPSIIEVRNELGLSGTCSLLTDIGDASVNDCSGGGDLSTPISLLAWAGYNHAALPASASAFSGNPGDTAVQAEDEHQDRWVYMSWGAITCTDTYEVYAASGSGGSLTKIATTQEASSDRDHADLLTLPETSRYYIIRAVAGVGSPVPTTGPDSAELHLRTTPARPKSPAADDSDGGPSGNGSGNLTIGVSWNNGTSPGVRVSKVEWRWKKIDATNPGAPYTAYQGPTAVSVTSFTQNIGSGHSLGDKFGFEFRYEDQGGGGGTPVSATSSLYWFT